jgi:hypothetical protein
MADKTDRKPWSTRTLYVREDDADVWDAAERQAEAAGISLSQYVKQALSEYNVPQHPTPSRTAARRLLRELAVLVEKL